MYHARFGYVIWLPVSSRKASMNGRSCVRISTCSMWELGMEG